MYDSTCFSNSVITSSAVWPQQLDQGHSISSWW